MADPMSTPSPDAGCPCCGWPVGNRAFAPRNGGPTGRSVAPCVADRYENDDDATRAMVVRLDEIGGSTGE